MVISDIDFTLIDERKQLMDSRGHYSRPELLSCRFSVSDRPEIRPSNELYLTFLPPQAA
jgi:hypothetical protein